MPQERVDAIIEKLARDLAEQQAESFVNQIADTGVQSPIESLMAAALLYCLESRDYYGNQGYETELSYALPFNNLDNYAPVADGAFISITPQMYIGPYCADFYVRFRHWRGGVAEAVIECDGHDFHERTKQQAARDKRRDRFFQSKRLIVLRYTGSEIYSDALKCAADALALIADRAENG